MKEFHTTKTQKGFTLVELSIVMIIIGLLIGGILKGQELISNAKTVAFISETKKITVAYNMFIDVYHGKPGDLGVAKQVIPGCANEASCRNGNGNGVVGSVGGNAWANINTNINSENTQFWKHLAAADLIGGIRLSTTELKFGDTFPSSSLGNGFHVSTVGTSNGSYPSFQGLIFLTRNREDGQWLCGVATGEADVCSVTPRQALRVDTKIDDGHAQKGRVGAISMSYITGCGTPNTGINGNNGYSTKSDRQSCDMFFWLGH